MYELKKDIENLEKREKYNLLLKDAEILIKYEEDFIANLSNIAALVKFILEYFWVGFYLVKKEELVLGPFQGPVACTRIKKGKGVCGTCWEKERTILVPNVNEFKGHISCSSKSKSEIVVPGFLENEVVVVMDIDSEKVNDFDEIDKINLEFLMKLIEKYCLKKKYLE